MFSGEGLMTPIGYLPISIHLRPYPHAFQKCSG
jgi:hypothetical protein